MRGGALRSRLGGDLNGRNRGFRSLSPIHKRDSEWLPPPPGGVPSWLGNNAHDKHRVSHGTSFLAPGSLARRRLARVIHHQRTRQAKLAQLGDVDLGPKLPLNTPSTTPAF